MEQLESHILDLLLDGEHPALAALRSQRERATIRSREYSGVGFFTGFQVPPDAPRATPESFQLGDVWFRLDGCEEEGGVVLFVRDGRLDVLEGYLQADDWPSEVIVIGVGYLKATRQHRAAPSVVWQLEHSTLRDMRYLDHQLTN